MLDTNLSPWPSFSKEEIDIVSDVLMSNRVNYWTGTKGKSFEKNFAQWCGASHAIALANGTLALDLALKGLRIGVGDEVIVTSRTFLASATCIVNAGADPVFADVDLDTQNLSAKTIKPHLSKNTKAIIVVHLAGQPAEMDDIMTLASIHGLFVIEDCSQAHGAMYKGKHVGTIGDVGTWSFCQDKIMTTGGEGGMVATNCDSLWSRMWSFKDHGKDYYAVHSKQHPPGFRWLHESIGTNWRMTEMQAALGNYQLTKMQEWTSARTTNANMIKETLTEFDFIRVPDVPDYVVHAYYKFYAFVIPEKMPEATGRDSIVNAISDAGVPCYQGSCSEVYLEKAFENTFRPAERLTNAKILGETSLMFLVHPTIDEDAMGIVCSKIRSVLKQFVNAAKEI